ncbi:MAG: alpha/beta hydrolase [Alphaproteobacteria bacterium]|nr:alpha/beta hydrolase [Alphaproteobacteria bacterium]
MPEVIFSGPAGRIEARYHHSKAAGSPIAILLHPHPTFGGTMNNPIVHTMYQMFQSRGFSVLRFNFRGVGRSQGVFENGAGELSDAASALDWLQSFNREAKICWIAGVSFGAWISMQLLMRRPEISGFISVAPLAKHYDFSFLAPCPASLVSKLKTQKGISVEHKVIPGANHFFQDKIDELSKICSTYLDKRLAAEGQL